MILQEILDHKRREVDAAKTRESPERLARRAESESETTPLRDFHAALSTGPAPRVIAEIKRCSPSKGEIRAEFDPLECAKAYADNGAAAISVLTDERFFGGHLEYLSLVRREVSCPLLRKDFVVDEYQVDEARAAGADAVLLIVAALDQSDLLTFQARAHALGLAALVEVHDEAELERALAAKARIVGINNRNLKTFDTDLAVTERLAPRIPEGVVVVGESGIFTPDDVERLARAGAGALLVGESLMREQDMGLALRRLRRTS